MEYLDKVTQKMVAHHHPADLLGRGAVRAHPDHHGHPGHRLPGHRLQRPGQEGGSRPRDKVPRNGSRHALILPRSLPPNPRRHAGRRPGGYAASAAEGASPQRTAMTCLARPCRTPPGRGAQAELKLRRPCPLPAPSPLQPKAQGLFHVHGNTLPLDADGWASMQSLQIGIAATVPPPPPRQRPFMATMSASTSSSSRARAHNARRLGERSTSKRTSSGASSGSAGRPAALSRHPGPMHPPSRRPTSPARSARPAPVWRRWASTAGAGPVRPLPRPCALVWRSVQLLPPPPPALKFQPGLRSGGPRLPAGWQVGGHHSAQQHDDPGHRSTPAKWAAWQRCQHAEQVGTLFGRYRARAFLASSMQYRPQRCRPSRHGANAHLGIGHVAVQAYHARGQHKRTQRIQQQTRTPPANITRPATPISAYDVMARLGPQQQRAPG